ncbi:hypothetical protein PPSIR1_27048 [Plesiocystis pacifica SIR-1]|uniref:Uncharacterized protein n=1 Tax=Plesiocystis pacifica SIR-1 TaxID=391625 RepID=A6GKQ4_9BACT|nr:hypothetical protein PPSIR1_27048 [Plesiocystis pacifica SIR-1]
MEGWRFIRGGAGLYRDATSAERRRYGWAEHSLVFATPLEIAAPSGGEQADWVSISVPEWNASAGSWRFERGAEVAFERVRVRHVQSLALGYFVEHREGSSAEVRRPIFELYGALGSEGLERSQLLMDDAGALLLRHETESGGAKLVAGYRGEDLDIPAPPGYAVASISPMMSGGISRAPLEPFSCENGACEPPDQPLDECQDGVDNDGDGQQDLCDWNCLPHRDQGADSFPDARSRVEHGKNYALMGGGGLCTELQDTWMVTFADWALSSSEFLNEIRAEDDPVHYRIFSCWVFPNEQAFLACQHGAIFDAEGDIVELGEPQCPAGMDDYPYKPSANDPHPGLLLYGEATARAWIDFELNTLALGPYGEPANAVGFLTNDTTQTCETTLCAPSAGLATSKGTASTAGRFVVTNANSQDWLTLAHETAHTLGILHDDYNGGFMRKGAPAGGPFLGTTLPESGVPPECVGVDNNVTWSEAFATKHLQPRSSGWRWTGCAGVEHACAPLGKPGWTCNNAWCEPK